MFEDRPDTVLADIARAQRVRDLTSGARPNGQDNWGELTSNKTNLTPAAEGQKAQDLLLKAREDLRAGRIDAARRRRSKSAR